MSDSIEKKLQDALEVQKRIEDKMKFIEDNSDELTDQQLNDLAEAVFRFEQSFAPEIDKITKEMEDNKNKILDPNILNNKNSNDGI